MRPRQACLGKICWHWLMELGEADPRTVSGTVMEEDNAVGSLDEIRLQRFREWLQVNGVQSRFCEIRPSSNGKHAGLGIFATQDNVQGVLMVTPLILAITPMTVLQDPFLGPQYCRLFEEGDVDDRLLIMLFLVIEHARGQSSFWAPYLDVLPKKFGTPLCYSEDEKLELKGTSLFHATQQQLSSLRLVFDNTVKDFAESVLSSVESERREVNFQDFMWANSIFWTRALNIPCSQSFVFPAQLPIPPAIQALQLPDGQSNQEPVILASCTTESFSAKEESSMDKVEEDVVKRSCPLLSGMIDTIGVQASMSWSNGIDNQGGVNEIPDCRGSEQIEQGVESLVPASGCVEVYDKTGDANATGAENNRSIWVEGLVPGIDFCNHDHRAVALWEVDGSQGSATSVPNSMYLITGPDLSVPAGSEIFISYGNKGNEELLYLYGFVTETNPDDYLMIYFPKEALEDSACSDTKSQLLAELKLPLRWLLPSSELQRGFYGQTNLAGVSRTKVEPQNSIVTGHSWTGHRKASVNVEQIVFPEDLLTALRIVAMEEDEVYCVVAMLEEISDPGKGRVPTDVDIRAAVWEVCGNAGALQLLVDLLTSKVMEIEEGTGSEDVDLELLVKDKKARLQARCEKVNGPPSDPNLLSENKRACVIYRKGQKLLSRLFLQEAEMALEKCID